MPDLDDLFAEGSVGPSDVPAEEPATVSLDLPDLDDLFAGPNRTSSRFSGNGKH